MKLLVGIITLLSALIISAVAGYFSVVGLGLLFAAAFWPVVVMGASLEAGKLVAASWLKANWHNPRVGLLHKLYLMLAVMVLMMITAVGIYGYLAKGHLEQEAPLASVELQIEQIENRISQFESERSRLEQQRDQLDQTFATVLGSSKNQSQARAAERVRKSQEAEREALQQKIDQINGQLNTLSESLVPLRLKISDVSAKLGPLKYVAQLFGWNDPSTAVQMVIIMVMIAFDPLAVMLVLSGTISIGDWMRERRPKKGTTGQIADTDQNLIAEIPVAPVVHEQQITERVIHAPWPEFSVGTGSPVAVFGSGWETSYENALVETSIAFDAGAMQQAARRLDKETMIEILERNPDFIQEVIDAIERPTGVDNAQERSSRPVEKERKGPDDTLTWFTKPWFERNR